MAIRRKVIPLHAAEWSSADEPRAVPAIAIFSTDPPARRRLEQLLRRELFLVMLPVTADSAAMLALIEENKIDVIVADLPSREELADWKDAGAAVIALVHEAEDTQTGIDAFSAGASAILPRTAAREEILAAIKTVTSGLAVLPHALLLKLLDPASVGDEVNESDGRARLTPRELEVLAAMADGASNKAIARKLSISFHTAKFHVGAIRTAAQKQWRRPRNSGWSCSELP
jgi:DNA-binding NarL/FixJ family response regulator